MLDSGHSPQQELERETPLTEWMILLARGSGSLAEVVARCCKLPRPSAGFAHQLFDSLDCSAHYHRRLGHLSVTHSRNSRPFARCVHGHNGNGVIAIGVSIGFGPA